MEVVLVEPGKEARLAEIGSDLKSLQAAVGGYIEAAYFFDDPVALICNEEGKVYGMPYNRAVRDEAGKVQDIIAGPFFVCGLGEDDFSSITRCCKPRASRRSTTASSCRWTSSRRTGSCPCSRWE